MRADDRAVTESVARSSALYPSPCLFTCRSVSLIPPLFSQRTLFISLAHTEGIIEDVPLPTNSRSLSLSIVSTRIFLFSHIHTRTHISLSLSQFIYLCSYLYLYITLPFPRFFSVYHSSLSLSRTCC